MKVTKRKCKIIKRIMMIFMFLPFIAIIPIPELEWSKSLYFLISASAVSTYVLLINFPSIVKKVHSRPLYYDDLEDGRYVAPAIRKRFQFIFVCILQITLTIIISGLIYYYYDRLHNTELSTIEIFGVLGGFISLLLKIENFIGKFTLACINIYKNRTHLDTTQRMRSNSLEFVAEV